MSTVIISDMYLFLVYAVLSLGSTDDAFLTTICLRKPHLEHHSPSFSKDIYYCTPISPSSYICGVVFQGLSVSTVIISDRYLFLVYAVLNLGSTDDVFLTTICLRKPHLEHHSPSFFQRHVVLFHLPATFAEWFSGIVCEYSAVGGRYLLLVYAVLNLGSADDVFDHYLLEETTLRTSLAFVFSKDMYCCTPISPSSYICGVVFQGLSVSTVIISDRYLFLVYAVLSLGSTDDAFLIF